MKQLKWVVWLALLLQLEWITLSTAAQQQHISSKTQSSIVQLYNSNRQEAPVPPTESVLGSIYRKSRQSRCVRCYEDRYGDERSRYYGSSSGGGHSSRSTDNWYYPYDRYDDRYRSEDRYRTEDRYRPGYDRYSASYSAGSSYYRDRDDRLGSPPIYDRYEGRGGYDRYDRRGGYEQDRYSDYYRDRPYERPRGGSYDRDYYDRSSSSRYDYRNYRPYDETYRGQSGFDNSGRGYYFAAEESDRPRYSSKSSYNEHASSSPCGVPVQDCPYASGGGGGRYSGTEQVTSRPINSQRGYGYGYSYGVGSAGSGSGSGAGAATPNKSANNSNNNTSQNQGWGYVDDRDKQSNLRGNDRDGNRGRERERERDRRGDQQSNSYSGRPPRPLGGSYLFDRDLNTLGDDKTIENTADKDNNGDDKANGVSNISSSAYVEQNRDMTNGGDGGGGVDGDGSIQVQKIVRDKQ